MSERRIALVTTSRADFGIFRPVMRALEADPRLEPGWFVSGSHLLSQMGRTVAHIEADPAPIWTKIPCFDRPPEYPSDVAASMSRAMAGMGSALAANPPDILVCLGDRYEMFALAAAATSFRIPIAHLHGGEVTHGAIDDMYRHALTKLAHLHFVSTEDHARRVKQLGEEAWRVHVCGAPALDAILGGSATESDSHFVDHVDLRQPFVLVSYHAETLDAGSTAAGLDALLRTLREIDLPVVFTGPNADEGGETIRTALKSYCEDDPRSTYVESLGIPRFYDVMRAAAVMLGNSSSALIEAPSFELPVVNIGGRQGGRTRGDNVIDADPTSEAVLQAAREALVDEFRQGLVGSANPYGDGSAGPKIANVLAEVELGDHLITKRFVDMTAGDDS